MSNIEVGDLVARISFDDTGLNKAMAQIERQMKLVQAEFGRASSALKGYGKTEEELKTKSTALNQQMQLQQQRINKLNEAFQKSVQEKGEDDAATQRLAVQLSKAQEKYNNLDAELRQVNKDLEEQRKAAEIANSSWTKLGDGLTSAGQKMQDVGKKMTDVGKSLSMKVTAPIVALGTLSAKAAIDFESAFAGVRKTVDASEEQFAELSSGIRNMAKTMPAAATEIAAVAESAGQLGIQTDNILEFSEVMIGLGEATNLAADEAATQLARLANITQMSQGDFDRLGSSLVALGNTMATTESEIVAMSLRLAAQGKQIGLTEAEITALAATMSSLGIEAEAGGTAMTMVLKKIQTAVGTGGKNLEKFAAAARMSSDEFAQAFRDRPIEALDEFVKGLAESSAEGANLTSILGELGIKGIREADVLLRMAGASDLLAGAVESSTLAWQENTALTDEVAQRYATTESQMKMFKNQVTDLAIQIGNILMPIIRDIITAVTPWIEKFAAMDQSTQKVILALGGVAAAVGPALIVIGSLLSSVGKIVSTFGKVSAAVAKAGGAATIFKGALTALTGPVGLIVAGIAALTVAGVALVKHLRKDAIPEIKRFGDDVSESTQKSVGAFMDLSESATMSLNELAWSGKAVTQEMSESIAGTFESMGNQILDSMTSNHEKQIGVLKEFFAQSSALTEEEEQKAIAAAEEGQAQQAQAIEDGQARIKEILSIASAERRALTKSESEEINRIQDEMLKTGIAVLSENELEQRSIMERMAANAEDLSARQAADVVKNSNKQKDESIAAAEEQYNEIVKEIIRQRDEVGSISAEQAEMLIKDATMQRDQTVNLANDMHNKIVDSARTKAGENVDLINWETGEVYKKWEIYWNKLQGLQDRVEDYIKKSWNDFYQSIKTSVSNIVNYVVDEWNKMIDWFKAIPDRFKQIGKDIMNGLKNGIQAEIDGLKSMVKDIGNSIGSGVKDFFGIRSPSRLMMSYGQYIGEGLALGMDKTTSAVARQAAELSAAAAPQIGGVKAPRATVASGQAGSDGLGPINFEGMFAGAIFNVRSDSDIRAIAQELFDMSRTAARGAGA